MATDRNWFLKTVGAPRAWQMVQGGKKIDFDNIDWARIGAFQWGDIRIAHLDHGYTSHPATRNIVQPTLGRNYMDAGATDPRDPLNYGDMFGFPGHGTRTGSVLVGADKAEPFLGAAPRCMLVPYRVTNRSVLNLGGGTSGPPETTNIAKALDHAIESSKCQIVSISLGAVFGAPDMGAAIDRAYEKGVIVVCAAGQIVEEVVYPGKYPQTISCGGFKPGYWPYYQYRSSGIQPDIWAPGTNVWRGGAGLPDDGTNTYDYDEGDGTSYSTAMIAGLAALFLRQHEKTMATKGYTGWQRVELFRSLLTRGSRAVRGVDGARAVQFPGVLRAGFDWPKPSALKKIKTKAEDMVS